MRREGGGADGCPEGWSGGWCAVEGGVERLWALLAAVRVLAAAAVGPGASAGVGQVVDSSNVIRLRPSIWNRETRDG